MIYAEKSTRILLIYPPSAMQRHQSCPLGILLLAAVLEKRGYHVEVMDANAEKRPRRIHDIVQHVRTTQPDVVGITLVTTIIQEAYQLALALKKEGIQLLAGGPHATLYPEEPLEHGFDAVVIGEGENVIVDAVESLLGRQPQDRVKGWIYRDPKGKLHRTEPRPFIQNLDDLPLPARHMVDPEDYGKKNSSHLHSGLFSSRGCPARCAFCSGHLFGKKFRFRSVDSIVDEIAQIYTTHGTRQFHFVDDALTVDKQRIKIFCQRLRELKMPITWSMMTRIDLVDEALLQQVADAGCTQIDYGVESGHPETLRKIHKPHTIEHVKSVIPMTAEYGIRPYVFFILGFPWETTVELDATYSLIRELSVYVDYFHPAVATVLVPFPGTEIYETYKQQYHLEKWWLSDHRRMRPAKPGRDAYYEAKLFSRGIILEADFFHYSPEVKHKIYEIMNFMCLHNFKKRKLPVRLMLNGLYSMSQKLDACSPALERVVFYPVHMLEKIVKH